MKTEVTVQVKRGGVTQTVKGQFFRSAGRSRWRKARDHLLDSGKSLVAFVYGLLLASLYGIIALFVQKQPLWFCVHVTQVMAILVAFGMGLSTSVWVSVMILLPSLCSGYGKKFLIILFASVLLSGPVANTVENVERTAASLLCGAELAANQTQELMQKAVTPLFSSLDKIKEIGRNAVSAAGRVRNFIDTLTDSIRHVARTLRNVLHFLVDIGDVCNDKLGSPYRKCQAVFAEARADCIELLGEFKFLCDILDGFLPLCSLARAGELFCIIPSYIGEHLKKRLEAPVLAAFERMKREFDFNFSASVVFDVDANSSRSLQEITQDILEEVSSELHIFQVLSRPLAYVGFILLACSFLRAVQYRHRYLHDLNFDNIYITKQFEELDQVASRGGDSALPITCREGQTYIKPLSFQLTTQERRAALMGVASILRHMVMGSLLVALDFLVFWMLDHLHHQVKVDIVARAPVTVVVAVNGSGYASDIFRDLVASFNILQGGNITVISRKCLLEPSEPNYITCFILGFILGLALLLTLTRGFVQRSRRLICAYYHPEREQERIRFLRQKILDQRKTLGIALRKSAARIRADRGAAKEGFHLHAILQRLPGGSHLSHLLALSSVSCLSCGEVLTREEDKMVACDVPQCPGLYCRPCFYILGNRCAVCVRPLTSEQEDSEEELDSSDDDNLSSQSHMSDRTTGMMRSVSAAAAEGDRLDLNDHSDPELSEEYVTYEEEMTSDDSDTSFYSICSL